jgi:aspartyl aminopeptidase
MSATDSMATDSMATDSMATDQSSTGGAAAIDEAAAGALLEFLGSSPSPYHAVQTAAGLLDAAGFARIDPAASWPTGPGRRYVRSGGALVAVVEPARARPATGFGIVAAHTDSPTLRVKPNADIGAAGWQQVGVDVYGGALLNTWLDRDLGVAGRLALRDGSTRLVRIDTPILRVPQLAIHLDREVNTAGLKLDRQTQIIPVSGLGPRRPGAFRAVLADAAGVCADDVLAHDLALFDLAPPARLGTAGEFVSSGRLDDQFCAWAAVTALIGASAVDGAGAAAGRLVVALFDHEEVGSASTTGAGGSLLPGILERVVLAAGGGREDLHRALVGSLLVSADMAHAAHPNYPDRVEPAHAPLPNGGPVVKVNAGQRYATDGPGHAAFVAACERARVPHQVYVHRSNLPCGSTIGPILATRLGIATVDVGAAQLSMHSARELAGAADAGLLARALTAALTGG